MKYSVKTTESNLVLIASDSKTFLEGFTKLPAGEYTVSILSDASRSGKHHRKLSTLLALPIVNTVLEFIAILLALGCIVPLWIIGCALI